MTKIYVLIKDGNLRGEAFISLEEAKKAARKANMYIPHKCITAYPGDKDYKEKVEYIQRYATKEDLNAIRQDWKSNPENKGVYEDTYIKQSWIPIYENSTEYDQYDDSSAIVAIHLAQE